MDDYRNIRDRQFHDGRGDDPPGGGPTTIAVKTTAVATYPTAAQAFYAVVATDIFGPEVEGGTATMTAVGNSFYAANLGTAIPPQGTELVASNVPQNRWVFRYDG